ncbi:MAG: cell division protein FtsW, partial [Pseudomonadota bacterium]
MTALSRADRSAISTWWWTVDRFSLGAIALLALAGLVLVMAAGPAAAERKAIADQFYFVFRQFLFIGPAVVLVFAASLLSPVGVR